MTNELECILDYTIPEDGRSENPQGKNFGNAQLYKASLLSFINNIPQYLLKISTISRSDNS